MMTIAEVAADLGCDPEMVKGLIQRGALVPDVAFNSVEDWDDIVISDEAYAVYLAVYRVRMTELVALIKTLTA
jgi:hypothetical protein